MEKENYIIIENRPDLTPEEVLKGMDFESALKPSVSITPKLPFKGIIIGATAAIGIAVSIYVYNHEVDPEYTRKKGAQIDSVMQKKDSVRTDESPKEIILESKEDNIKKKDSVQVKEQAVQKTEDEKDEYANGGANLIKRVEFKQRFNTDAETAITIKDSIYGPTNVSMGKGDYCEFKHATIEKAIEQNSAWFKFEIKKDTLLTFHIVPTLKTDDYDFALFKCDHYNCMRDLKLGKLKPVTFCYSWNTTQNANTGLSRKGKDTTFQIVDHSGSRNGRTYAGAIRVKAGETYYLMVNNSLNLNREPEGFMIYFYNYLPKSKVNTYATENPYK